MLHAAPALATTLGPTWMDPQWLLERFGGAFFVIACVIVFIECGLLFPILPGDSLLFAIGLFIANGALHINLGVALIVLSVVAFAGNVSGYEIGRLLGPPLAHREGRFLKPKYFEQTHVFFERYGNRALVLGRFVPIVRTFVTVVAGIGQMDRRRFLVWSAVGAVLWASGITLLGYFLGQTFPSLKDNLEVAMVAVVAVSLIPMVVEYLRHRRRADAAVEQVADEPQPGSRINP